MSRFREIFANRHAVLPVVHVAGREQALRNATLARDGGADGAFLISHGHVSDEQLLEIHRIVAEALPGFWLGVNCLSLSVEETFCRVRDRADGVWVDNAMINEARDEQPAAERVLEVQRQSGWR